MKIKLYKRKPRGSGLFAIKSHGKQDIELIYMSEDKVVFDYPNMQGSQLLEDAMNWIEYSSNKLDFQNE